VFWKAVAEVGAVKVAEIGFRVLRFLERRRVVIDVEEEDVVEVVSPSKRKKKR
jgi:hypothetical protein